jgi:hypothetical protein
LWLAGIVAGAASTAEAGREALWKEIEAGLSMDRVIID